MDSKKGIICIILGTGLLRKYILIIYYYLKLIRINWDIEVMDIVTKRLEKSDANYIFISFYIKRW